MLVRLNNPHSCMVMADAYLYFKILVTDAQPRIVARGISATTGNIRARVENWLAILIHIDHTCGFTYMSGVEGARCLKALKE